MIFSSFPETLMQQFQFLVLGAAGIHIEIPIHIIDGAADRHGLNLSGIVLKQYVLHIVFARRRDPCGIAGVTPQDFRLAVVSLVRELGCSEEKFEIN